MAGGWACRADLSRRDPGRQGHHAHASRRHAALAQISTGQPAAQPDLPGLAGQRQPAGVERAQVPARGWPPGIRPSVSDQPGCASAVRCAGSRACSRATRRSRLRADGRSGWPGSAASARWCRAGAASRPAAPAPACPCAGSSAMTVWRCRARRRRSARATLTSSVVSCRARAAGRCRSACGLAGPSGRLHGSFPVRWTISTGRADCAAAASRPSWRISVRRTGPPGPARAASPCRSA